MLKQKMCAQDPSNPPYSPVSEAGVNRRGTPDPFADSHHESMIHSDDIVEQRVVQTQQSLVGKRLAGYNESPVHMGQRKYFDCN